MDSIVAYIGFFLALFGIIMIYSKKPRKVAYVILCVLLLVFGLMFGLDILQYYNLIPANRRVISLSLTMLFAPLFYLYSKYITKDYEKFDKYDYLHAIPSLTLISIFVLLKLLPANNSISFFSLFEKYRVINLFFGFVFQILLVYYSISAIRIVVKFKRQTKHFYSFNSYKNSLNWLVAMILLFLTTILLIIISSILFETYKLDSSVYIYRHIVEIFFVYVLSVWGFSQNQLNVAFNVPESSTETDVLETSTGKYQKSGLKDSDIQEYLDKLTKYLEASEVWKDPELSISKLSNQISIPKHQLSELLNEHLGKSFYVLINEYRIEYAKKLLVDKISGNWSILAIAYECGFNSKTAFNTFFKKHTQLTPSEFKKKLSDKS
jgi:AraC-like DNA-binding protein